MKNLNLRSSLFGNYCFGAYVPRKEMCLMDIKGETPVIEKFMEKYVNYGLKHEKHGIAEWVLWQKDIPKYVLTEQKNMFIPNWLNLSQKDTISISSTPDGFNSQMDTILEVKCTLPKKECKPNFETKWLPQVFGQQMIANMYFEKQNSPCRIKKTHLINWGENRTKIYEILFSKEFVFYLIELLEEYSLALLSEDKEKINGLEKKAKKLEWNKDEVIKLVYEGVVKN